MTRDILAKVLIAEDDPASALILQRFVETKGYHAVVVGDGQRALQRCRQERFDVLLLDWMMPCLDGLSLIRELRRELDEPPPILMVTALASDDARHAAVQAGADAYIAKPVEQAELCAQIEELIARARQPSPSRSLPIEPHSALVQHVGVGIAAGSGSSEVLQEILGHLDPALPAAYFIVAHGPPWMVRTFASKLAARCSMDVRPAEDRRQVEPGQAVICPADVHLTIDPVSLMVRLSQGPRENFVRPSADPMLRSLASVFGTRALAVVLAGAGRDGSRGCEHVHAAGGIVLVQEPSTAANGAMPQSVVSMGLADEILMIDRLAEAIQLNVDYLAQNTGASTL